MMDILVFGDAHCELGQDISRFKWLGEKIVELKPSYIVQLGDFTSMLSLSHWDMNKKAKMEGRRYQADIEAALNAVFTMLYPLHKYNDKQRRWKEKLYQPTILWFEGNHEDWIRKYLDTHPEMLGYMHPFCETISNQWPYIEGIPYREYRTIKVKGVNISFTHAPMSPINLPLGGKYVSERALDICDSHVVFGHTHRFQHMHRFLHGRGLKQAINAGCFFDETPEYAKGAANEHFRCVLGINVRDDNLLDVQTMRW